MAEDPANAGCLTARALVVMYYCSKQLMQGGMQEAHLTSPGLCTWFIRFCHNCTNSMSPSPNTCPLATVCMAATTHYCATHVNQAEDQQYHTESAASSSVRQMSLSMPEMVLLVSLSHACSPAAKSPSSRKSDKVLCSLGSSMVDEVGSNACQTRSGSGNWQPAIFVSSTQVIRSDAKCSSTVRSHNTKYSQSGWIEQITWGALSPEGSLPCARSAAAMWNMKSANSCFPTTWSLSTSETAPHVRRHCQHVR